MRRCVLLLAVLLPACATHVFVPPSGPGEPAPEAEAAWTQATRQCLGAVTYSAQLHVSGRVGTSHLNRTVVGALTVLDHILLELREFGQLGFRLAGEGAAATLLLPRDNRVVTARADEIVEALTGLKLGPKQLLAIVSGCITTSPQMTGARRFADLLAVDAGKATLYLRLRDGAWQVSAGIVDGLIVEYLEIAGGYPRRLSLVTETGRTPAVALTIDLDQLNVNITMPPSAFVVVVPASAAPMTLEELRTIGPLRAEPIRKSASSRLQ